MGNILVNDDIINEISAYVLKCQGSLGFPISKRLNEIYKRFMNHIFKNMFWEDTYLLIEANNQTFISPIYVIVMTFSDMEVQVVYHVDSEITIIKYLGHTIRINENWETSSNIPWERKLVKLLGECPYY
jgi:hypothetical protein